jgi:hypothetical protein
MFPVHFVNYVPDRSLLLELIVFKDLCQLLQLR